MERNGRRQTVCIEFAVSCTSIVRLCYVFIQFNIIFLPFNLDLTTSFGRLYYVLSHLLYVFKGLYTSVLGLKKFEAVRWSFLVRFITSSPRLMKFNQVITSFNAVSTSLKQ